MTTLQPPAVDAMSTVVDFASWRASRTSARWRPQPKVPRQKLVCLAEAIALYVGLEDLTTPELRELVGLLTAAEDRLRRSPQGFSAQPEEPC